MKQIKLRFAQHTTIGFSSPFTSFIIPALINHNVGRNFRLFSFSGFFRFVFLSLALPFQRQTRSELFEGLWDLDHFCWLLSVGLEYMSTSMPVFKNIEDIWFTFCAFHASYSFKLSRVYTKLSSKWSDGRAHDSAIYTGQWLSILRPSPTPRGCLVYMCCVFRKLCCVFTLCVVFSDMCFVFSLFVLCFQKVFRVFTLCVVFSDRCFVFSLCVLCFQICVLCFHCVCCVLHLRANVVKSHQRILLRR